MYTNDSLQSLCFLKVKHWSSKKQHIQEKHVGLFKWSMSSIFEIIIPPAYEVYRGYIVFAFSVYMFVCVRACLLTFFCQRFLGNYLT